MSSRRGRWLLAAVFVVALIVLGMCFLLGRSSPDSVRTVSYQGHSFEVPKTWPPGHPSQWCGRKDLTPTYYVPSPTTLAGCEPEYGYGVAFVAPRETLALEEVVGVDDEFRAGSWVAVHNFEDLPDWSLLVIARTEMEAKSILASIK